MPGTPARDMEAWSEVALETSPIGMGLMSALESRYVRVNRRLADLHGRSVEDILGAAPYTMAVELTHPDDMVAEQALFAPSGP